MDRTTRVNRQTSALRRRGAPTVLVIISQSRPSPLLLRAPSSARTRRAGLNCDALVARPWRSAEETSSRPSALGKLALAKGAPQRREVVIVRTPASLILGRFSLLSRVATP